MISRMSKRERTLMIITIAIGCVVVLYQVGITRVVSGLGSSSAQLAEAKRTFNEYVKQLSREDIIERQYGSIGDRFPPLERGKKPAQQFSEQVAALCSSLGFQMPDIEPPSDDEIEGVEEYKFITLAIRLDGTIDRIANLLKGLDSHSLLIKELSLRSVRDSNVVKAKITVARITKVSEEELKAKREKEKKRVRRRPARFRI